MDPPEACVEHRSFDESIELDRGGNYEIRDPHRGKKWIYDQEVDTRHDGHRPYVKWNVAFSSRQAEMI